MDVGVKGDVREKGGVVEFAGGCRVNKGARGVGGEDVVGVGGEMGGEGQ